ncbi:hypothetical protein V5E97_12365 [Singulisphaera sp. Ch08]|uniref:Uncharacterized protein n=1 Tax=Singulisphaera sp. Ch08 TaxID=3120278 RepID=A0AAU7CQA7_9BACT
MARTPWNLDRMPRCKLPKRRRLSPSLGPDCWGNRMFMDSNTNSATAGEIARGETIGDGTTGRMHWAT